MSKQIFLAAALFFGALAVSCDKNPEPNTPTPGGESVEAYIDFTVNGIDFRMIDVEPGTFTMGTDKEGALAIERPAHEVALTKGYYLGETEVTQELWTAVMGNNPSQCNGQQNPVDNISYIEVTKFILKLNQLTGREFRLPTEAEWEFAARGGNQSHGYLYSGSDNIEEVGWYYYNTQAQSMPVKQLQPNELGIYDMCGNVQEMCSDYLSDYPSAPVTDPTGPETGIYHVDRGGGFMQPAENCCVYSRIAGREENSYNFLGFRLAL